MLIDGVVIDIFVSLMIFIINELIDTPTCPVGSPIITSIGVGGNPLLDIFRIDGALGNDGLTDLATINVASGPRGIGKDNGLPTRAGPSIYALPLIGGVPAPPPRQTAGNPGTPPGKLPCTYN
jgi:hypothetical protein